MAKIFTLVVSVLLILFLLPVFTGGIFNAGSLFGLVINGILLVFLLFPGWWTILPDGLKAGIVTGYVLLSIAMTAAGACMVHASMQKCEGRETMIVLGGALKGTRPTLMVERRLEAAWRCLEEYPDMTVIVSGGQGKDEDISEAEAMGRWLRDHGIEESRILEESRSTTTDENIRFSKEIIQENNLNESVVIATDGFHEYRASLLCRKYGLSFHACPSLTPWWVFPVYFVRECMAIWREWLRVLL